MQNRNLKENCKALGTALLLGVVAYAAIRLMMFISREFFGSVV